MKGGSVLKLAKLDGYNYMIYPGLIRIFVTSMNDPDMGDILTEIDRADGRIYVEGLYLQYSGDCRVVDVEDKTYIDIYVIEES